MRTSTIKMVIITKNLDTDDRLIKEVETIGAPSGDTRVLAVERDHPKGRKGVLGSGAAFHSCSDTFRPLFRPGRGIVFKAGETLLKFMVRDITDRRDVLWIHDPALLPYVQWALLLRKAGWVKKVIWDLHELPPASRLQGRWIEVTRKVLQQLDVVVVTNAWRLSYIEEKLGVSLPHAVILENYPSRCAIEKPVEALPETLSDWLKGRAYFILQGGASADRHYPTVVKACMEMNLPVVVVGKPGEVYDENLIYNTGWIPQEDVYTYIDHAAGSLIFYDQRDPNAWYCSPNRLFQAIGRGCPVLTGNNPPLKSVVEESGAGVAADTDGADTAAVKQAITQFLKAQETYRQRAAASRHRYIWEGQTQKLSEQLAGLRG
ncbi:hypothetical protein CYPRO_2482 [Cyclonatronum proteinivorum]|uniref:Spore protein YkvP/CgeB glycosyl transferase-like domain-containing protein n=1 Tax=Cyclonatronum proteinivorum TaxID=1457365 RepID=A0A345UMM2_9BACT|nr:glycosyltransferase family 1 protein [Cyclonatronum proteinivorum]AXJ01724.1 hypothetical protein CYPRO_2482 [Cyclonatronum proteinivorum]